LSGKNQISNLPPGHSSISQWGAKKPCKPWAVVQQRQTSWRLAFTSTRLWMLLSMVTSPTPPPLQQGGAEQQQQRRS
jgi:hypothetical protein